jgi:hypothetical protein
MITTRLIGGLGNNMFQYAIANIVAEEKGYNLTVENIHQLQSYFPAAVNITDRVTNNENILRVGYNSNNNNIQNINLDQIINHNGGVHFEGFFQKNKYYEKYANKLKGIFSYNDNLYFKPNIDDLIIHVRLGDYVNLKWNLSPDIYIKIIEDYNLLYKNCFIITDDPYNIVLKAFERIPNCYIQSRTVLEDLTMLRYAKRVIISQSSFSWWGTFLSTQLEGKVFVPVHTLCHPLWTSAPGYDDIDLIPDNNRYTKVLV